MKLENFKNHLENVEKLFFRLPDGNLVPSHFHVTEIGKVVKDFIDCGGVVRHEERVNFQLWEANDYDHTLHPEKLIHIIELSQKTLGIGDLEIEVEYQGSTIGKYGLDIQGDEFSLTNKETDCLARDSCKTESPSVSSLKEATSNCTPGGGCC